MSDTLQPHPTRPHLDAVAGAIREFKRRFARTPKRIRIGEDFEKEMNAEAVLWFCPRPNPEKGGAFHSFMNCDIVVDPDAPITAFTVECENPLLTLLCTYPPQQPGPARTRFANQAGPTFVIDGIGDFQESDSLSFEGVESINPVTGEPTGHELRVACLAYDAAHSTLIITPQLIISGKYRNASGLPAAGARITNHSKRREP